MKNKTEMKSLLRTILEEAKRNKVMFRYDAYELWNWNCSDYIVEWGYDIDQIIKTFEDIDGEGGIQFLQAKFFDKECKYGVKFNHLYKNISEHWGGYENDNFNAEFLIKNKNKISYAINPNSKTYNITIGEGNDNCYIDEEDAVGFLLAGDGFFRWDLWNNGVDCLSDYTSSLIELIDIEKIYTDWDEKEGKFQKGLL